MGEGHEWGLRPPARHRSPEQFPSSCPGPASPGIAHLDRVGSLGVTGGAAGSWALQLPRPYRVWGGAGQAG